MKKQEFESWCESIRSQGRKAMWKNVPEELVNRYLQQSIRSQLVYEPGFFEEQTKLALYLRDTKVTDWRKNE